MPGYNFTDGVRSALQAARDEAASLGHEYVGTEHILLGLLRTDDGVPTTALAALGVPRADLRKSTLDLLKPGTPGRGQGPDLPYTSRAKKVLEEAMHEARGLGHTEVGTEHILLGSLREGKGVAAQALGGHGISLEMARAEILRILKAEEAREPGQSPRATAVPPSSFLVVIENANGSLGARRFPSAAAAIEFLKLWGGK